MAELQIFIIIKYYMYTAKCLSQRLSLVTLLNKIKYFHKLEQYTATKNNCLDKLERKWFKYNAKPHCFVPHCCQKSCHKILWESLWKAR